jgi:hypothetical protein
MSLVWLGGMGAHNNEKNSNPHFVPGGSKYMDIWRTANCKEKQYLIKDLGTNAGFNTLIAYSNSQIWELDKLHIVYNMA